jgi:pSer/pThr/pTyr-binding forkhead associated (FHA) protein
MIHLRPKANGYDDRYYLALKGTGAFGDGEILKLCLGESVVCGRSRHCDWSLKRTPGWLTQDTGVRTEVRDSLPWKTTSRRHCRITYLAPDIVDIENLSPNGTVVDGHQVDRILLTDCRAKEHQIQLGPHGVTLQLEPGALPLLDPPRDGESVS